MKLHYTDHREQKCPYCGKQFIEPPENVYKEFINGKEKDFCSWNCLCKWRKAHEKPSKIGGGHPVPVRKVDCGGCTIAIYSKIVDAANANNCSCGYIKTRLEYGNKDERNNCYWEYVIREEEY